MEQEVVLRFCGVVMRVDRYDLEVKNSFHIESGTNYDGRLTTYTSISKAIFDKHKTIQGLSTMDSEGSLEIENGITGDVVFIENAEFVHCVLEDDHRPVIIGVFRFKNHRENRF